MAISRSIRLLAGSIAVYLSVASLHACGSSGPAMGSASSGGAGGSGGSNGAFMGGAGAKDGAGGSQATTAAQAVASGSDGAGSTGSIMDPVGDAHANESGSRLKAKWYKGVDGSKQWIGWYDSQRQEECSIARAADGKDRCLPITVFIQPTIYNSAPTGYYGDATCATMLVTIGCMGLKYVVFYTSYTCDMPPMYAIRALGKVRAEQTYYFKDSNGVCKLATTPTGVTLAEIGPEIQITEFAEASTIIE